MFHVITGGSGSGKSEYAESCIVKYHAENLAEGLYYIATMQPYGKEMEAKIARHRTMRSGKGFQTIECYMDLQEQYIEKDSSVILECMSNLVANECYRTVETKEEKEVADLIMAGIEHLHSECKNLVVVTNEVCSECVEDSEDMVRYKKVLSAVNRRMAAFADKVTEVVYGIPVKVGEK